MRSMPGNKTPFSPVAARYTRWTMLQFCGTMREGLTLPYGMLLRVQSVWRAFMQGKGRWLVTLSLAAERG